MEKEEKSDIERNRHSFDADIINTRLMVGMSQEERDAQANNIISEVEDFLQNGLSSQDERDEVIDFLLNASVLFGEGTPGSTRARELIDSIRYRYPEKDE